MKVHIDGLRDEQKKSELHISVMLMMKRVEEEEIISLHIYRINDIGDTELINCDLTISLKDLTEDLIKTSVRNSSFLAESYEFIENPGIIVDSYELITQFKSASFDAFRECLGFNLSE